MLRPRYGTVVAAALNYVGFIEFEWELRPLEWLLLFPPDFSGYARREASEVFDFTWAFGISSLCVFVCLSISRLQSQPFNDRHEICFQRTRFQYRASYMFDLFYFTPVSKWRPLLVFFSLLRSRRLTVTAKKTKSGHHFETGVKLKNQTYDALYWNQVRSKQISWRSLKS